MAQSELLLEKYRKAGAAAELVKIPDAPHAFWNDGSVKGGCGTAGTAVSIACDDVCRMEPAVPAGWGGAAPSLD